MPEVSVTFLSIQKSEKKLSVVGYLSMAAPSLRSVRQIFELTGGAYFMKYTL